MSTETFVLQQFILTSEGIVHGLCYNQMLTAKRNAPPAWIRVLAFWGVYITEMSMSWFRGERLPSLLNLTVAFSLTQILMHLFYREKLQTRFFAYLLLYMVQGSADILVGMVYILMLGNNSANYMQDNMIPALLAVLALGSYFEWAACSLWQKKKGIRTNGFVIAGAGLLVMILYLFFIACGVLIFDVVHIPDLLIPALFSVCGIWIFMLFWALYQQKQHESRKVEWENLNRVRNTQEEYFRFLEAQERKLSFVRHDALNILGTAGQLLSESRHEDAQNLLESYLGILEQKPETDPVSAEAKEAVS